MVCSKCGEKITIEMENCPKCGAKNRMLSRKEYYICSAVVLALGITLSIFGALFYGLPFLYFALISFFLGLVPKKFRRSVWLLGILLAFVAAIVFYMLVMIGLSNF